MSRLEKINEEQERVYKEKQALTKTLIKTAIKIAELETKLNQLQQEEDNEDYKENYWNI